MKNFMNSFKDYIKNIYVGITSIIAGMILTIKYFFKKKITLCYPEKKEILPLSFRGMHKYNKNKCIACGACKRACPVSCIDINSEGKGKDLKINEFKIDYGHCLFCSLCEEACPMGALFLSSHFDLSVNKRKEAVVDFVKNSVDLKKDEKKNE